MTIRRSIDDDFAAIAALVTAAEPDSVTTEADLRRRDRNRDPRVRWARWVAEDDGALVGVASWANSAWSFHPQRFFVNVTVHPDARRRGIGGALYETAMDALAELDPISLLAGAREDRPDALRFLEKRGYAETMREWESRLPLATYDPSRFAGAVEKVEAQGIRLASLAELQAEDPDALPKLWELENACMVDVPSTEAPTPMPYEQFLKHIHDNPNFKPESFFVAVGPGGEWAAISMLLHPTVGDYLDTGLTGVKREWRRKGIALGLKLKAMDYAKRLGADHVRTENATTNVGMLAINDALGFVRQPAWISHRKVLREDPASA